MKNKQESLLLSCLMFSDHILATTTCEVTLVIIEWELVDFSLV